MTKDGTQCNVDHMELVRTETKSDVDAANRLADTIIISNSIVLKVIATNNPRYTAFLHLRPIGSTVVCRMLVCLRLRNVRVLATKNNTIPIHPQIKAIVTDSAISINYTESLYTCARSASPVANFQNRMSKEEYLPLTTHAAVSYNSDSAIDHRGNKMYQ